MASVDHPVDESDNTLRDVLIRMADRVPSRSSPLIDAAALWDGPFPKPVVDVVKTL